MKLNFLVFFLTVASLCMVAGPVAAHHGSAAYDSSKVTTLKGTVTEFRFTNPHVQVLFDVTDSSGHVDKWVAEAVSVPNMLRDGWTKSTLKPGDPITASGYPAKNGSHSMRLSKVVLSDGRTFSMERAEDYAN